MSTFVLDGFDEPVTVRLPSNVTREQFESFPAFRTWKATLKKSIDHQKQRKNHPFNQAPCSLKSIDVQSVDYFGKRIGFLKMETKLENTMNQFIPGICFLRGGSVAVLMILRPKDSVDERWVVMTMQPRIPAGSLSFMEIPAGMLDEETGNFAGKAAKEIQEETGLEIPPEELVDMTQIALEDAREPQQKHLERAMYPSPGGSDEYIKLFVWEKVMDRQEIEDLRGRLTGLRSRGELITLRLCEYEELWREGARDAKTLAAWALYEGLKRSNRI